MPLTVPVPIRMPVPPKTPAPPKRTSTADLARRRREMDRLNARLAALLQSRARLARKIGALKRDLGLPAASPEREREMLERILRDASPGFERSEFARIWRSIFAVSRRLVVRDRMRR